MKVLVIVSSLCLTTIALAQDPAVSEFGLGRVDSDAGLAQRSSDDAAAMPRIQNPFTQQAAEEMLMMEDMMMDDYGEEMGGGMGDMGAMMGYGGMGGDGMESRMSPNAVFRVGLRRALQMLKDVQSEKDKETVRGFIRTALEERYAKMISKRRKDLDRLKQSVAKLENDLNRREAAKDRVVQVQMQSVQLAAEGLLQLNELQQPPGMGGGDPFGGGDDPFN